MIKNDRLYEQTKIVELPPEKAVDLGRKASKSPIGKSGKSTMSFKLKLTNNIN
jgi:hypothetical protein